MAVKKTYVAKRFIDVFVPGDAIPGDFYEAEDIAKMLNSGHIVEGKGKDTSGKVAKVKGSKSE